MPIDELKDYAVGLQGKEGIIAELTGNAQVLNRKKLGKESVYVVVRNQYTREALQNARLRGVEVLPVSADDLCVYLTAKHKGGIDDVFDRD